MYCTMFYKVNIFIIESENAFCLDFLIVTHSFTCITFTLNYRRIKISYPYVILIKLKICFNQNNKYSLRSPKYVINRHQQI
jgi:hypothetical protein